MKKTTFTLIGAFLFTLFNAVGQTITTGDFDLSTTAGLEFSAKIEVSSTLVTLTMVGPDDRWLGIGLGVQTMTETAENGDVVIYDGVTLTDRNYVGFGLEPALDTTQDWTVISDVVVDKVRTVVATRALNTGDIKDYVFTTSDTSVDLTWARGNSGTFTLGWHGSNRGITIASFHVLSAKDQKLNKFEITPNPGRNFLNINLIKPESNLRLEVFDVLGKQVYANNINGLVQPINVSQWNSGVYLVRLSSDTGSQTKRFIKQ